MFRFFVHNVNVNAGLEILTQAFRDIASLLGKILGESSLVPSDVAAGLVTTDMKL